MLWGVGHGQLSLARDPRSSIAADRLLSLVALAEQDSRKRHGGGKYKEGLGPLEDRRETPSFEKFGLRPSVWLPSCEVGRDGVAWATVTKG